MMYLVNDNPWIQNLLDSLEVREKWEELQKEYRLTAGDGNDKSLKVIGLVDAYIESKGYLVQRGPYQQLSVDIPDSSQRNVERLLREILRPL